MNPRTAALVLWALDSAERVVKSFLVGWLGAWLAIQDRELDQLFAADTLGAGLAAAAGSLILAAGARKIGSKASASWLPALLPEVPLEVDTSRPVDVLAFDGRPLSGRRAVPIGPEDQRPTPRPRRL